MTTKLPPLWRSVARGARVHVPVILVAAGLQTLLVAIAGTPGFDAVFVLLAVASAVVTAVGGWVIAAEALAVMGGGRMRLRAAPLVWALVAVVVAAASAVLFTPLAAVVLVAGTLVVAVTTARHRPGPVVPTVVWVVESLVLVALVALVDLLLGFFVAGTAASFVANLVAGAVAVVVLTGAARLVAPAARPAASDRLP